MVGADVYVLTDKSSNGTLVNGRRVKGRTPLKPGDRIQVGDTVLRCEVGTMGTEALAFPSPAIEAAPWPAPTLESAAWAMPAPLPAPVPVATHSRRPVSNLIPITIGIIGAIVILAAVVVAATLLAGRSGSTSPAPAAPAPATQAVSAPVTATVEISATVTITPTVVEVPTPVTAPVEGRVKEGQGLNVRAAPDAMAQQLYALGQQAAVVVQGRNDAGDWYLIQCQPNLPADQTCWVAADYVDLAEPNAQIPIAQP